MDVNDILKKYGKKIESDMNDFNSSSQSYSQDYQKFRQEMYPELSSYEKWCHSLGSLIKINFSLKDQERVKKDLEIAHLNVEPWQALSLGFVSFLSCFLFASIFSVAVIFMNEGNFAAFPLLTFSLICFFGLFVYYFLNSYPKRLANSWRLKASSQMVPAILYVVVYMRHTSNLEKAISFAAEHLEPPLAMDFKKMFYDLEIGKFSTIKDALGSYLETWRDYSSEFIESFNLIEGSLYEPDNSRRITVLEKSLQVVLDGVYDKMLKFVHDVRSPLTNVYMLGVVLPTMALALLPLASSMLQGIIKSYHVFILFNLIVPFFVFYLIDKVLFLRPGGYGETSLLEKNPLYPKFKSNKYFLKAFLICFPIFLLASLPLIFQFTPIPEFFGLQRDYTFSEIGINFLGNERLFGFKSNPDGSTSGPFGILSLLLGLFFPLGIALMFSIVYSSKTKDLIKSRDDTKKLEDEFNSSLFQLGNRLANGVPAELAFGKVAESSKGLMTQDFFNKVNYNIQQMGMGVEGAIFDNSRGALVYYPSNLIATSMRILVESSKKGLKIAAVSLMSISEYIKNMKKITARLKDMLAEIVSDMKSNMVFLAPLLSGIVVGLSVMITTILNQLSLDNLGENLGEEVSEFAGILSLFDISSMISPYVLQFIVGVYLIQIILILSSALVIVDSGEDKLQKYYVKSKNLLVGIGLFFVVAFIAIISLYLLSSIVLASAFN